MGCVDQIFTHDRHIFVPVDVAGQKDTVLGLFKIVYRTSQPLIIGINAVHPERVYVVEIDDKGTRVWVEW